MFLSLSNSRSLLTLTCFCLSPTLLLSSLPLSFSPLSHLLAVWSTFKALSLSSRFLSLSLSLPLSLSPPLSLAGSLARSDLTVAQLEQIYKKVMNKLQTARIKAGEPAVCGHERGMRAADELTAEEVMHTELQSNNVDLCDEALLRILMRFKLRDWRDISLRQFAFMFRKLKLAELFCAEDLLEDQRCTGILHILDYTPMQVFPDTGQWPLAQDQVQRWFFRPYIRHRPSVDNAKVLAEDEPVRWIHMRHLDPIMLLRLALKYHRHPLHVEDALLMKRQPSKIEGFGTDYFCAINLLQLITHRPMCGDTQGPDASAHMHARAPVELHCSCISIFVFRRSATDEHVCLDPKGCPDTVISIFDDGSAQEEADLRFDAARESADFPPLTGTLKSLSKGLSLKSSVSVKRSLSSRKPKLFSENVPRSNRSFKNWWANPQRAAERAKGQGRLCDQGGGAWRGGLRDIFAIIKREISLSSTRVRQFGPKFFMYAVLDKTVDELIPICEAYMERLAWLQSLSPRVLRDHLDEVARIKSEARDVYRTVRPLVGIIKV